MPEISINQKGWTKKVPVYSILFGFIISSVHIYMADVTYTRVSRQWSSASTKRSPEALPTTVAKA